MKVTEEQRLVPEATKKGLGNAKIAVLELLELKISFAPPQPWRVVFKQAVIDLENIQIYIFPLFRPLNR